MTQPDKAESIISLLPFLFAHQDHIPGAAKTTRQEWISERSSLDPPPAPPPAYNMDCNGRCHTCLAAYGDKKPVCPPEVTWKRLHDQIRRRYRIRDLEEALLALGEDRPVHAQAVWAVFVEPWPGELVDPKRPALGTRTEAISSEVRRERADLAEAGVQMLAEMIVGEVVGYGERRNPRDNEIRQLAAQGFTRRRIARELRCSLRDVQRVLVAHESAVGG